MDNQALLSCIEKVFRLHGYEAASLTLISQATGLERASLYHRFPGGKVEMALSVANQVFLSFQTNVFEVIDSAQKTEEKLAAIQAFLLRFYEEGRLSCLLDTMSLSTQDQSLNTGLKQSLEAWIAAFSRLATELGCSPKEAEAKALGAIVNMQGTLVVSRVLKDNTAFLASISDLGRLLRGAH